MILKAIIVDCDGVLTDGRISYSEGGEVTRHFNTLDGEAMYWFRKNFPDMEIILLSAESHDQEAITRRALKMDFDKLIFEVDKLAWAKKYCEEKGWDLDEIVFVGNSLNDVDLLKEVGLAYIPKDSTLAHRDFVRLSTDGGKGVLYEVVIKLWSKREEGVL